MRWRSAPSRRRRPSRPARRTSAPAGCSTPMSRAGGPPGPLPTGHPGPPGPPLTETGPPLTGNAPPLTGTGPTWERRSDERRQCLAAATLSQTQGAAGNVPGRPASPLKQTPTRSFNRPAQPAGPFGVYGHDTQTRRPPCRTRGPHAGDRGLQQLIAHVKLRLDIGQLGHGQDTAHDRHHADLADDPELQPVRPDLDRIRDARGEPL